MDHLIGVLPVVGMDSIDGFAAGILVAGACFLALATPWRAHKRDAAARYETPPKPRPDTWTWQPAATKHYATSAKPPVPDQTATRPCGREESALAADNRLPRDRRSPMNAAPQHWGLPADLGPRANAVPPPREARLPDGAVNTGTTSALGERLASPGDMNSRPGSHRAAHPLGDPTFGSPASQQKPPGGRHAPRHAAPAPSLGGKMSSLFTTRSLADSSRG
jgi:hypothetical protein